MNDYHQEETLGKAYDSKLMARLLSYAKPFWKYLLICILLLVIIAGAELLRPYFIKVAIDDYIDVYDRKIYVYEDVVDNYFVNYNNKYYSLEKFEEKDYTKSQLLRYDSNTYLVDGYINFSEQSNGRSLYNTLEDGYIILDDESINVNLLTEDEIKQFREDDIDKLIKIGIYFLGLVIITFFLNYAQVYLLNLTSNKIIYNIRDQLFSHLQNMNLKFFDKNPVGRLVTRVTNDTETLHQLYTDVLVNLFKDVFTLLGIVIIMLLLDWKLALLSFTVIPILLISSYFFRIKIRKAYRLVRVRLARINSFLSENFTGMKTIHTFKREKQQFNKFNIINQELLEANKKEVFIFSIYRPSMEIIRSLGLAIIIWYGGGEVIQGSMQFGVLFAFINYIKLFFQPINNITEKYNILQSSMASSERIFKLLDEESTINNSENPKIPESFDGEIEFKNVWFAYNDEDWVLKDISFKISKGDSIAFVGATGAGKSSIINLMSRFYDIQKGEILVDGINIKDIPVEILRKNIGVVLQDVFTFAGDIKTNISLNNDIPIDEIIKISKYVNLHGFIEKLPKGYDEPVMERGATLSSGQKQLLAFARALASNPKILVLDEATSNIDTETEVYIQDAMKKIVKGKTSIAIAHRLSTIQSCDKIIVLHKGELKEIGDHQSLLNNKGLYYNLYKLQYRDTI